MNECPLCSSNLLFSEEDNTFYCSASYVFPDNAMISKPFAYSHFFLRNEDFTIYFDNLRVSYLAPELTIKNIISYETLLKLNKSSISWLDHSDLSNIPNKIRTLVNFS